MAKCDIRLTFTGSAEDLCTKARNAIEKTGGQFTGSAAAGSLVVPTPAGQVKGTYSVTGQQLQVSITDKPFIVPCSTIQDGLKKFVQ